MVHTTFWRSVLRMGGVKKYIKNEKVHVVSGDVVAVEGTSGGYDIGQVSLMGELVQLQLKKYKIRDNHTFPKILTNCERERS